MFAGINYVMFNEKYAIYLKLIVIFVIFKKLINFFSVSGEYCLHATDIHEPSPICKSYLFTLQRKK